VYLVLPPDGNGRYDVVRRIESNSSAASPITSLPSTFKAMALLRWQWWRGLMVQRSKESLGVSPSVMMGSGGSALLQASNPPWN
jgi:hypothetical protein